MAVSSIYGAYWPTIRQCRGSQGTFLLRTIISSSLTLSKLCSESHLAMRTPPCSLRLMSALEIMRFFHQSITVEEHRPPHVTFGNVELKTKQLFIFLGCIISSDAIIHKDIDNRLSKVNSSFGRRCIRVLSN